MQMTSRLGGLGLVLAAAIGVTAQQPTFRAGVTLVTTDVIVRDAQGRFVSDLTRDNFTVLEDDAPQAITSFSLILGGRTFTALSQPTPPPQEGLVLPPAK